MQNNRNTWGRVQKYLGHSQWTLLWSRRSDIPCATSRSWKAIVTVSFLSFKRETASAASFLGVFWTDPTPCATPLQSTLESDLMLLNYNRISTHLKRGSRDKVLAWMKMMQTSGQHGKRSDKAWTKSVQCTQRLVASSWQLVVSSQ